MHIKAVSDTNVEIAKQFGLDVIKCELAGILHDSSAVMKPADMVLLAKDREIILDEVEIKPPFFASPTNISNFCHRILWNQRQ